MNAGRWITLLLATATIAALFFTWVTVPEAGVRLAGFSSEGPHNFGKPGIMHLVFLALFLPFFAVDKIWSIRAAFFIAAFNLAWAVRNFIAIGTCSGGICPQRHSALYIVLLGSALIPVSLLWASSKKTLPVMEEEANEA